MQIESIGSVEVSSEKRNRVVIFLSVHSTRNDPILFMFILFSRIILSNWRSLMILFLVILFASTGFITLRQVTTNIDSLVASETRPLFGADLIVSPR